MSVHRSVGPSVRRSIGPSVHRSIGPSVRRSVRPPFTFFSFSCALSSFWALLPLPNSTRLVRTCFFPEALDYRGSGKNVWYSNLYQIELYCNLFDFLQIRPFSQTFIFSSTGMLITWCCSSFPNQTCLMDLSPLSREASRCALSLAKGELMMATCGYGKSP